MLISKAPPPPWSPAQSMLEQYVDRSRNLQDLQDQKNAYATIEKPATDPVNHPQHYARWKMEPVEFIAINDLPWWLANVIKYTMRFDAKDGLKDLYKARSYLDMKIREVEGEKRFWEKPVAAERAANVLV